MKRAVLFVIAGLILLAAGAHAEFVRNRGFEEGTTIQNIPGWEILYSQTNGVAIDSTTPFTGRKSLKVYATDTTISTHGMKTTRTSYYGGNIKVTGWMKTKNVIRGSGASYHIAAFTVYYLKNNSYLSHEDVKLLSGTHDWRRYEKNLTPPDTADAIEVWCYLWGRCTGTAWFDKITLQYLPSNRGFERGDSVQNLPGWQLNYGAAAGVTIVTDTVFSGSKALRVYASDTSGSSHGMHTVRLPFYSGNRIDVYGYLRTNNVRAGDETWHKAALQVNYLDGASYIGHDDIILIDSTHDWTKYEKTITPSSDVDSLADSIEVWCYLWGNAIGTVWFDDIHLEFLMISNGNFEQGPTMDSLKDWTYAYAPQPCSTKIDSTVHCSGSRSIKVYDSLGQSNGTHGIRSVGLPYYGGRLHVSGWMKTDSIIKGTEPWHISTFMVSYYHDYSTDQIYCGEGIRQLEGANDWLYAERTLILPKEVDSFQVWCYLWGTATGHAWFDSINVELIDDPYTFYQTDTATATARVVVDFEAALGDFKNPCDGADISHISNLYNPAIDAAINHVRDSSNYMFRYLRLHEGIYQTNIYSDTGYYWAKFDTLVDKVVGRGFRPILVLGSMPIVLASRTGSETSWHNQYPPGDTAKYRQWKELNDTIISYCKRRSGWGGKDSIRNWYFETWNEPDSRAYLDTTFTEYMKMYDYSVTGAKRNDTMRIGGFAGATWDSAYGFLRHCQYDTNAVTDTAGTPLDLLSWHCYTSSSKIPSLDNYRFSLDEVKRVKSQYAPRFDSTHVLLTEWDNNTYTNDSSYIHDRPYDAAFKLWAIREMMDRNYPVTFIDHAVTFCLTDDGNNDTTYPFKDDLGLFSLDTITKPNYRMFQLLDRLKGTQVQLTSSNDAVGGVASIMGGDSAWVFLYNFVEDNTRPAYETSVTVKFDGLPVPKMPPYWYADTTSLTPGIGPRYCDPCSLWMRRSKPTRSNLNTALRDSLHAASAIPSLQSIIMQGDSVIVTMKGFTTMFFRLRAHH